MRALTIVAVLLASGARSLCAQHGGQIEIGGFATYTRYDSRFQLDPQIGARGWLGFFLGDHFSLEVDGNVAQPRSTFSGVGKTTAAFASASLVLSSGGLYVLGGYSRLHMGPGAPYNSDLNAVHAGLGQRLFFAGNHAAVRVEARAYYRGPGAGFGPCTRFDRAFLLDNQIGGGGRLGFWITDWLGIEGDGLYMRPKPIGGGSGTNFPVWFASGSLVLNFGSEKSFYLLGGYSALDFNSSAAGGFRDAGAHAALGDRIYISDGAALRLEGRAYYAPSTQLPGSKWAGQLGGSAGLSFFLGSGRREKIYPEIPKPRRDSIVAAGGK